MNGGSFAPGSVCYKPYMATGRARDLLDDFFTQTRLAEASGFDGLGVSEHHCGVVSYLPNPLQAIAWALARSDTMWAAPCPMLLLLRSPRLVAEEISWLAVAYPGRVGACFAAGAFSRDFDLAGTDMDGLAPRFRAALADVATVLQGGDASAFGDDQAIAELAGSPVPVVSAASSATACRRAAELGTGIMLESQIRSDVARRMVDTYLDSGGRGPRVLQRRIWVGEPPHALIAAMMDAYRDATPDYDRSGWLPPEATFLSGAGTAIGEELDEVLSRSGATSLALRMHANGVPPEAVHEQIERVGAEVLPVLRSGRWSS
jgi:alkanesulfonate monooxygenase SsuD/methylene tetrahydromethanopterin reductase-like flavin-dependent oxidoreductase (luciferase family)